MREEEIMELKSKFGDFLGVQTNKDIFEKRFPSEVLPFFMVYSTLKNEHLSPQTSSNEFFVYEMKNPKKYKP